MSGRARSRSPRKRERSQERDRRGHGDARDAPARDSNRDDRRGRSRSPRRRDEPQRERPRDFEKPQPVSDMDFAPIKREPVSLEDRLSQLKEASNVQEKPRFVSAEERQAAALLRLEARRAEQRAQERMQDRERDSSHHTLRRQGSNEDKQKQEAQSGAVSLLGARKADVADAAVAAALEKEQDAIRARYLGQHKAKQINMKYQAMHRFDADWDTKEDTSRDTNELYDKKHDAAVLFGRGLVAGVDRRLQKTTNHYVSELEKLRAVMRKDMADESEAALQAERDRKMVQDEQKYTEKTLDLPGSHWKQKALLDMTERDWRIFKEDFKITVQAGGTLKPIRSWEESSLPPLILKAVNAAGYKEPSPIQRMCIPFGMKNRDLIGVAQTGSGKTAAFVIPMLCFLITKPRITAENSGDGPYSLILAPTRELATQIQSETIKFAKPLGIRTLAMVGGQDENTQIQMSKQGVEILVATPGRLIDLLMHHQIVLPQCTYVVLDEADRMIDMGFEPQVQAILEHMPANYKPDDEAAEAGFDGFMYRQTFMFSATMPPAVERLAKTYMRRPAIVTVGTAGNAASTIKQVVMVCREADKSRECIGLIRDSPPGPVMVFVNEKKRADVVWRHLSEAGINCDTMHSGKAQEARQATLDSFKAGETHVLIGTDVVGRGIDIPDVVQVINYDTPKNIEDYTHRIGRTGRAGKAGLATTLLTMEDSHIFYDLKQLLMNAKQVVSGEWVSHPAANTKQGADGKKMQKIDR